MTNRTPEKGASKPHGKLSGILSVANTAFTVIGAIATVFSCVLAILAVTSPQVVQFILPPFGATPEPQVVYVTVPAPTAASYPTASPSPIHTPTPTLEPPVFYDDFDAGPRPDWKVKSGEWGAAAGKYTLLDITDRPSTGVSLIGNDSWTNYVVEVEVSGLYDAEDSTEPKCYGSDVLNFGWTMPCGDWSRAAILVHADGKGNGPALIVGATYIEWGSLEEGEWRVVSGTLVDGMGESVHIRIEVRGNLLEAFANGEPIGSYSGNRSGGLLGIWLCAYTRLGDSDPRAVPKVDNFSVTPLQ